MPSDYRPSGLLVPIVTPFAADGRVDMKALERLGAEILEAGASGLVALGTTGEPTSLTATEQADVVAVCSRLCLEHGADLVVGAGTNDTRTTIENHQALADVPGVSASLAATPYYVRPSEAGILTHFRAVAAASPVPVIAYNVPYRTGRGLDGRALLELAEIPNVAGLKQAVGALDADTLELLAHVPDGFAVLGGDDAFLLPTVLMGGHGAIAASGHLATERFAAMLAAGAEGDVAAARPHAEALLALVGALFAEPSPAVLKALLHEQGRIPTPDVRLPHVNATAAGVERGRSALAAALEGSASAAG